MGCGADDVFILRNVGEPFILMGVFFRTDDFAGYFHSFFLNVDA